MTPEVYCEPFMPLADTLMAANNEGIRVDQYLERLWGCSGQAERVVAEMQTHCDFPKPPVIVEIGPGSGRFLHHTMAGFRPTRYEIYEPATEWSRWLDEEYTEVTAHSADGRSLAATQDETCDLVVAHGVFVYLKMLSTLEYFIEIGRVLRPNGFAIFDVFTENAFDLHQIRSWLNTDDRFPAIVPESLMLDTCEQLGLKLTHTRSEDDLEPANHATMYLKNDDSTHVFWPDRNSQYRCCQTFSGENALVSYHETCYVSHSGEVSDQNFTPDGSLVTGSADGLVRQIDPTVGSEIGSLKHRHPIHSVEVSPDGRRIATGSGIVEYHNGRPPAGGGGILSLFDLTDRSVIAEVSAVGPVSTLKFSKDSTLLAESGRFEDPFILKVDDGEVIFKQHVIHMRFCYSDVAMSLANKHFAYIQDSNLQVLNLIDFSRITTVEYTGFLSGVNYTPDGKFVVIWRSSSIGGGAPVWILNSETWEVFVKLFDGGTAWSLSIDINERCLAVAGRDEVLICTIADGGTSFQQAVSAKTVCLSRDGNHLYLLSNDGTISVIDVNTSSELFAIEHECSVSSIAVRYDETRIATACDEVCVFESYT